MYLGFAVVSHRVGGKDRNRNSLLVVSQDDARSLKLLLKLFAVKTIALQVDLEGEVCVCGGLCIYAGSIINQVAGSTVTRASRELTWLSGLFGSIALSMNSWRPCSSDWYRFVKS